MGSGRVGLETRGRSFSRMNPRAPSVIGVNSHPRMERTPNWLSLGRYGMLISLGLLLIYAVCAWFVRMELMLLYIAIGVVFLVVAVVTAIASAIRGRSLQGLGLPFLTFAALTLSIYCAPLWFPFIRGIGGRLYLGVHKEDLVAQTTQPEVVWTRALVIHKEPSGFSLVFGGFLDNTWGLAYLDDPSAESLVGGQFAGAQLIWLVPISEGWYVFSTT